jgi:hypothetical protein
MDRRRSLAPEVRGTRRRLGDESGRAGGPRLGTFGLVSLRVPAKGHELLAGAKPVAGQAHDLAGRLSCLVTSLALPTFAHQLPTFAAISSMTVDMPSRRRGIILLI